MPVASSSGLGMRIAPDDMLRAPALAAPASTFAMPKSSTLMVPRVDDEDVVGLEVAVNDALPVRALERLAAIEHHDLDGARVRQLAGRS